MTDLHGDPEFNLMLYGDSRPRRRVTGQFTDKYGEESTVSVSVPLDATAEEKEEIINSVTTAINEIADFNQLPREQRLEHYLILAYKRLKEISQTKIDLRKLTLEDWSSATVVEYTTKVSNMSSTADFACVELPVRVNRETKELEVTI